MRKTLNAGETLTGYAPGARLELFLGDCVGIALTMRTPNDPHVCFGWLTEDDEHWFPGNGTWSSYFLPDAEKVLAAAVAWLKENAVPDVVVDAKSPVDGTAFGWKFK